MTRWLTRSALVALVSWASPALAWDALGPGQDAWRAQGREAIRGVTIGPIESSQQPGRGYGTRYTAELLDHLAAMGVNWVSVTPFGRLWSLDDTLVKMDFEAPYNENRQGIQALVAQAHARGIRVLLIPHLWVETEGWRGHVDPGSPEGWAAYHESYTDFVLAWARDAERAGADALSIGVECKSWSYRHGAVWTDLIARTRGEFSGLLTYSANWDEVDERGFLGAASTSSGSTPSTRSLTIESGATDAQNTSPALWHASRPDVRPTSPRPWRCPVLFVEVGYTTRRDAAVEPWLWPDGMDGVVVDEREQARALSASLGAFLSEEWFAGFFVWRYYANLDDVSQEAIWGFSPHAKQAETALRRIFATRHGADPEPWPWLWRDDPLRARAYPFTGLFPVP